MKGGYCWGSLVLNLSCGVRLIFCFIVLLTKGLCNQINLNLYQLTTEKSEQFILSMK